MHNWRHSWEYMRISKAYEGLTARRSQQPYIKHIDEGVEILKRINASELAIRAFILHPLFQSDRALFKAWYDDPHFIAEVDPKVLVLCMEYRTVANNYLSKDVGFKEPELSCLLPVNHMLIADKVQNQSDFLAYQKFDCQDATMSFDEYVKLDTYFKTWIEALTDMLPAEMAIAKKSIETFPSGKITYGPVFEPMIN